MSHLTKRCPWRQFIKQNLHSSANRIRIKINSWGVPPYICVCCWGIPSFSWNPKWKQWSVVRWQSKRYWPLLLNVRQVSLWVHFESPSNFDLRNKDLSHWNRQGQNRPEEEEVNYGKNTVLNKIHPIFYTTRNFMVHQKKKRDKRLLINWT